MPISATELEARAARGVRHVRRMLSSRVGLALGAVVLAAPLIVLHAMAGDAEQSRLADGLAGIATVQATDARWEATALRTRAEGALLAPAVHDTDAARIERALEAAERAVAPGMRPAVAELRKAFVEKAEVISQIQAASADSAQALAAAMRADVAVSALVRAVWAEFPQRERLVAAESLVARLLAEAQQYHRIPSAANRTALESYAADLPRVRALPQSVHAGLARLESDVDRILLLKPLEQALAQRLAKLDLASRLEKFAVFIRRERAAAAARQERYRTASIIYGAALLGFLVWLAARTRERPQVTRPRKP